jgi:hypothetical protein
MLTAGLVFLIALALVVSGLSIARWIRAKGFGWVLAPLMVVAIWGALAAFFWFNGGT